MPPDGKQSSGLAFASICNNGKSNKAKQAVKKNGI